MVQTDTNMREVPAGSAGCHSPLLYSQRLCLLNGGSFFISALYAGRSGAVFFFKCVAFNKCFKKSHLAWYSLFFFKSWHFKEIVLLCILTFRSSSCRENTQDRDTWCLSFRNLCVHVHACAVLGILLVWKGNSGSFLGHEHCVTSLVSMLLCLIFWLELLKVGRSNHVVNRES